MTTHSSLYADNQIVFGTRWEKQTSWTQRLTARLVALGAGLQGKQTATQSAGLDDRTLRDIGMSRSEMDYLAQDGAVRTTFARPAFHILD
jgi:hypothetical protein